MRSPTFGFPLTTTITCVEPFESGEVDARSPICVQRLLLRPGRSGEQPCPLRCSEGRMAERRAGRTRQTLPVRMPWPLQHEQRDPHDARQRACLARTPCQRRRLLRLGELGQTNFRRFTDSRPAGSTCWVPVYACVKTERYVATSSSPWLADQHEVHQSQAKHGQRKPHRHQRHDVIGQGQHVEQGLTTCVRAAH